MHSFRSSNRGRPPEGLKRCTGRLVLLFFGLLCVAVGMIGVVVPGLPTTVFLIVALWAFSKSSERFQMWLWTHPRFGPPLQAWHVHRVIPPKGKILAMLSMAGSVLAVGLVFAEGWVPPLVMATAMAPVAAYILSRASYPPGGAEAGSP